MKILLVDDYQENLLALEVILESPDLQLVKASSGAEALRCLLRETYAVILLDVAMPGMNGFEVAELVKQHEQTKHIPIIFLTAASKDIESMYRGYELGAVDYILKPLDEQVVKAKVAVFVELYRRGEEIRRQGELLKEAQLAELRWSVERRYRSLADAVPQLVFTAQPGGDISYVNQRWLAYTGLAGTPPQGRVWPTVIHPGDLSGFLAEWNRGLDSGESFRTECRVRSSTGAYRWHLCEVLPERDEDRKLVGFLGTFTDLDERKRIEEERAELLVRAQETARSREEFLSIASHELRTPLSALELQVQSIQMLLAKPPVNLERLSSKMVVVRRQADRLARLISEMLDVSRIEAGRLQLDREEVDLAELVREVAARFADELERGGSPLTLELAEGVLGHWDRLRLDQVVTNLLQNAAKYGKGKPIRIALAVDPGGGGPEDAQAVLTVEDQGIGISPTDQPRIFGRFERAVSSRQYGGMGVGLFIVDQILKANGGVIAVESEPLAGAKFTVKLPLGKPVPARSEAPAERAGHGAAAAPGSEVAGSRAAG